MWTEIPYLFQLVVIFVFGICLGSFLNVCIYRMPRNLSIVTPRSQCPKCHHLIEWYFNIPLLSYILLRGRCHECQIKISPRYFIVELITGFLFTAVYHHSLTTVTPTLFFIFFSIFILGLIVATFIDLEFFLIPDTVSLGGIPVGILASAFIPEMMGEATALKGATQSLFAGLFGACLLLVIAFLGKLLFKKEAMGMGDIKLMAMFGTFLGIKKVCLTLFFSSIVGSVIGIILIMQGSAGLKSKIPFGPYLAIGALIALFFGDAIWDWYFSF